MKETLKQSFLGFVRHALTTAGGAAVAGGVATDQELGIIVGGLVTAIGIVWSFVEKYVRAKKD